MLYVKIAPRYEILKLLLNAISKSQNKTTQTSNVAFALSDKVRWQS